ncbi:MAG: hypothetical protein FJX67_11125 [Alphaproteobacteria bacterium]|nr:hypothetical protein [Alphaproteobacteria bacterium]
MRSRLGALAIIAATVLAAGPAAADGWYGHRGLGPPGWGPSGWHHPYHRHYAPVRPQVPAWGGDGCSIGVRSGPYGTRSSVWCGGPAYYGPPPVYRTYPAPVVVVPYGPPPEPVYAPPYTSQTVINTWPTQEPARGDAYCREFQREVVIAGVPQQAYGTACWQPDGSWKFVGDPN